MTDGTQSTPLLLMATNLGVLTFFRWATRLDFLCFDLIYISGRCCLSLCWNYNKFSGFNFRRPDGLGSQLTMRCGPLNGGWLWLWLWVIPTKPREPGKSARFESLLLSLALFSWCFRKIGQLGLDGAGAANCGLKPLGLCSIII